MTTLESIAGLVRDALLAAWPGRTVLIDDGRLQRLIERALETSGFLAVVGLPYTVTLDSQGRNLFAGRAEFLVSLLANPDSGEFGGPALSGLLRLVGESCQIVKAIPVGPGEKDFEPAPEFAALEISDPGLFVYRLSFRKQIAFPPS